MLDNQRKAYQAGAFALVASTIALLVGLAAATNTVVYSSGPLVGQLGVLEKDPAQIPDEQLAHLAQLGVAHYTAMAATCDGNILVYSHIAKKINLVDTAGTFGVTAIAGTGVTSQVVDRTDGLAASKALGSVHHMMLEPRSCNIFLSEEGFPGFRRLYKHEGLWYIGVAYIQPNGKASDLCVMYHSSEGRAPQCKHSSFYPAQAPSNGTAATFAALPGPMIWDKLTQSMLFWDGPLLRRAAVMFGLNPNITLDTMTTAPKVAVITSIDSVAGVFDNWYAHGIVDDTTAMFHGLSMHVHYPNEQYGWLYSVEPMLDRLVRHKLHVNGSVESPGELVLGPTRSELAWQPYAVTDSDPIDAYSSAYSSSAASSTYAAMVLLPINGALIVVPARASRTTLSNYDSQDLYIPQAIDLDSDSTIQVAMIPSGDFTAQTGQNGLVLAGMPFSPLHTMAGVAIAGKLYLVQIDMQQASTNSNAAKSVVTSNYQVSGADTGATGSVTGSGTGTGTGSNSGTGSGTGTGAGIGRALLVDTSISAVSPVVKTLQASIGSATLNYSYLFDAEFVPDACAIDLTAHVCPYATLYSTTECGVQTYLETPQWESLLRDEAFSIYASPGTSAEGTAWGSGQAAIWRIQPMSDSGSWARGSEWRTAFEDEGDAFVAAQLNAGTMLMDYNSTANSVAAHKVFLDAPIQVNKFIMDVTGFDPVQHGDAVAFTNATGEYLVLLPGVRKTVPLNPAIVAYDGEPTVQVAQVPSTFSSTTWSPAISRLTPYHVGEKGSSYTRSHYTAVAVGDPNAADFAIWLLGGYIYACATGSGTAVPCSPQIMPYGNVVSKYIVRTNTMRHFYGSAVGALPVFVERPIAFIHNQRVHAIGGVTRAGEMSSTSGFFWELEPSYRMAMPVLARWEAGAAEWQAVLRRDQRDAFWQRVAMGDQNALPQHIALPIGGYDYDSGINMCSSAGVQYSQQYASDIVERANLWDSFVTLPVTDSAFMGNSVFPRVSGVYLNGYLFTPFERLHVKSGEVRPSSARAFWSAGRRTHLLIRRATQELLAISSSSPLRSFNNFDAANHIMIQPADVPAISVTLELAYARAIPAGTGADSKLSLVTSRMSNITGENSWRLAVSAENTELDMQLPLQLSNTLSKTGFEHSAVVAIPPGLGASWNLVIQMDTMTVQGEWMTSTVRLSDVYGYAAPRLHRVVGKLRPAQESQLLFIGEGFGPSEISTENRGVVNNTQVTAFLMQDFMQATVDTVARVVKSGEPTAALMRCYHTQVLNNTHARCTAPPSTGAGFKAGVAVADQLTLVADAYGEWMNANVTVDAVPAVIEHVFVSSTGGGVLAGQAATMGGAELSIVGRGFGLAVRKLIERHQRYNTYVDQEYLRTFDSSPQSRNAVHFGNGGKPADQTLQNAGSAAIDLPMAVAAGMQFRIVGIAANWWGRGFDPIRELLQACASSDTCSIPEVALCSDVVHVNNTLVQCSVPPGAGAYWRPAMWQGSNVMYVEAPDDAHFNYTAPVVQAVIPQAGGNQAGGDNITIIGRDFGLMAMAQGMAITGDLAKELGLQVRVGSKSYCPDVHTFSSVDGSLSITATTPGLMGLSLPVTVYIGGLHSQLKQDEHALNTFSYQAPQTVKCTPSVMLQPTSAAVQTVTITLHGSDMGFTDELFEDVKLGGFSCSDLGGTPLWLNANSTECRDVDVSQLPAGLITVAPQFQNVLGSGSAMLQLLAEPTITSITPAIVSGGTVVTMAVDGLVLEDADKAGVTLTVAGAGVTIDHIALPSQGSTVSSVMFTMPAKPSSGSQVQAIISNRYNRRSGAVTLTYAGIANAPLRAVALSVSRVPLDNTAMSVTWMQPIAGTAPTQFVLYYAYDAQYLGNKSIDSLDPSHVFQKNVPASSSLLTAAEDGDYTEYSMELTGFTSPPHFFQLAASNDGGSSPLSSLVGPVHERCVQGQYLQNNVATLAEQVCVSCPSGAYCNGSDYRSVVAQAGYWRLPWNQLRFEQCDEPTACLGWGSVLTGGSSSASVSQLLHVEAAAGPYALCAQGYTNTLCNRCMHRYSRSGTAGCAQCLPDAQQYAALIGGFVLAFVIVLGLIFMNLLAAGRPSALHVMLAKIFLTYLNQVALAASFELEWPDALRSMFSAADAVGSASDNVLSPDCVTSDTGVVTWFAGSKFFMRTTTMLLLPMLLLACLALFWAMHWLFGFRQWWRGAKTLKEMLLVCRHKAVPHAGQVAHSSQPATPAVDMQVDFTARGSRLQSKGGSTLHVQELDDVEVHGLNPVHAAMRYPHSKQQRKLDAGAQASVASIQPRAELAVPFQAGTCCSRVSSCCRTMGRNVRGSGGVGSACKRMVKSLTHTAAFEVFAMSCVVTLFLLHSSLTRSCLQLFTCRNVGDSSSQYLVRDLGVECNTAESAPFMYGIGVTFAFIWALGIPLMAYKLLWNRQHKLWSDRRTLQVLGFLHSGFRPKYYMWEEIIMLRKVFLAITGVLLAPFGIYTQTVAAMLVLIGGSLLHVYAQPYSRQLLNKLETMSLCTAMFTFLAGLWLYAEDLDYATRVVMTVLVVLANAAFVATMAYFLLRVLQGKESMRPNQPSSTRRLGVPYKGAKSVRDFGLIDQQLTNNAAHSAQVTDGELDAEEVRAIAGDVNEHAQDVVDAEAEAIDALAQRALDQDSGSEVDASPRASRSASAADVSSEADSTVSGTRPPAAPDASAAHRAAWPGEVGYPMPTLDSKHSDSDAEESEAAARAPSPAPSSSSSDEEDLTVYIPTHK